jgi:serine/threonine-protein phosphatase 2A activator
MGRWLSSEAYSNFVGWIKILATNVEGKKLSDQVPQSPIIDKLIHMLDTLSKWVDETPPIDPTAQRFGNKAYRDWLDRVKPVSNWKATFCLND